MSEYSDLAGHRDWSTPLPWTGKPVVKTYWDWLRHCYRTDVCILLGAREEPPGKPWSERRENAGKGRAPQLDRRDLSPQGERKAAHAGKRRTARREGIEMHKPITQETIEGLQAISEALGGTGEIRSITPARVCDHCLDEDKEAHPYYVTDPTGKDWAHLCNECFDDLGCSYPQQEPTCEICGQPMEWEDCWNGCDDGYLSLYEDDPLFYDEDDMEACHVCEGKGGWWVCPVAYHHQKPEEPTL